MLRNTALFIILLAFILFCDARQLTAQSEQSDVPRFEIGGQFTVLRLTDFDPVNEIFTPRISDDRIVEPGVGGRFTYNLTRNFALEAEANFFPRNRNSSSREGIATTGGGKDQVLFGPRIGRRFGRVGIFGKVRPGFMRYQAYPVIDDAIPVNPPFVLFIQEIKSRTFFALDVGGVVEYYPSRRTMVRFDLGDTIIRYGDQEPRQFNPAFTRHNLQLSVGFGFRF